MDLSFDEFCAHTHPRLVAALAHHTGDRWLAEELAQEALFRAGTHWRTVSRLASPAGWVFRTGVNLGRSHFRRRRCERRALDRMARERSQQQPDEADVIAVRSALQALTDKQREVVILRYYLRLTAEESAQVLGSTPGAVRALTHRAVGSLRAALEFDAEPEGASDVT